MILTIQKFITVRMLECSKFSYTCFTSKQINATWYELFVTKNQLKSNPGCTISSVKKDGLKLHSAVLLNSKGAI